MNKYQPKVTSQYTLYDLGIKENELMENVSIIRSSINLDGSRLTTLPKLKVIDGSLKFGDNKISDLRSLERIDDKTIVWDK